MLGSYQINVVPGKLPQKVASAFTRIFENMVGAEYSPLAYLGSKVVNGTNHVVLASQTLITGQDVHNVVLIVLNEKPNGAVDGSDISLVQIENVLSDGGALGGLQVAPTIEIPEEAQKVFDDNFMGFMGSKVTPFALLGTQMVNGVKYVFAAETNLIVNPSCIQTGNTKKVVLVTVFANYASVEFTPLIEGASASSSDSGTLGYAFTWLAAKTNKSWP